MHVRWSLYHAQHILFIPKGQVQVSAQKHKTQLKHFFVQKHNVMHAQNILLILKGQANYLQE